MCAQEDAHWEWSVFWRSDQLQSCTCETGDNTPDSIASAWYAFFEALPAGARILDLATGNGVLAKLAAEVSRSGARRFEIHGVDAADIDPARFVPSAADLLNEISFHPRTRLEQLPFAAGNFDAVVSQYGIEYTDRTRSLAEALRVLKPRGNFRFLLHAANSVLAERCTLQHRQAEKILASGLFPELKRMLSDIADAESNTAASAVASAQQSINSVGTIVAELDSSFAGDADRSLVVRVLAAVRNLPDLRRRNDPATLLDMADNIRILLHAQSRRLHAMKQAALSEQQARKMVAHLRESTGSEVHLHSARSGESKHCVGFWISGRNLPDAGRTAR